MVGKPQVVWFFFFLFLFLRSTKFLMKSIGIKVTALLILEDCCKKTVLRKFK